MGNWKCFLFGHKPDYERAGTDGTTCGFFYSGAYFCSRCRKPILGLERNPDDPTIVFFVPHESERSTSRMLQWVELMDKLQRESLTLGSIFDKKKGEEGIERYWELARRGLQ